MRRKRKDTRVSTARILKTLCLSEKPLHKSQIETAADVSHQTLRNNMRELKQLNLVDVVDREKWRTGKTVERYQLTDSGFYHAMLYNPDNQKVRDRVMKVLGGKFDNFTEREKRIALEFLKTAERVIASGRGSPNWFMDIHLATDQTGRSTFNVTGGRRDIARRK